MTRQEAENKLKMTFGIDHFYDEQWLAVERLLRGERILMIERTGFGKSLCFQFPATQFDGVTVVCSPLRALMRDQVRNLCNKGIPAAYINSEQSREDNRKVIEQALNGKIKILYIAPERQDNDEWIQATRTLRLSMVVIDEAHTISTWGHDFRPSFRRIINLVKLLPSHLPILATTATATLRVQRDIEQQIGGNLTTIRGSLSRPNFHLQVIRVKSEDEKMLWLAENIKSLSGTGLIYTGTRVDTEIYAKWLQFSGIDAIDYNAGFDPETRKEIEIGLMSNRWKCIVSTNALGMGIDKPDIRFIIHTQIPQSPIHYYQEIGRAGRDGLPTRIILFYNESTENSRGIAADSILPISFIENARPSEKKYQRVIDLLKTEPLTMRDMIKKANIKQQQALIIKADLIEQGIAKEVVYGSTKHYEYQFNAPELDIEKFRKLRDEKLQELQSMIGYVYTDIPRMKYLCSFLDSNEQTVYNNCDNTNLPKATVNNSPDFRAKLEEFRNTYFPILDCSTATTKKDGFKLYMPAPGKYIVEHFSSKDGEECKRYEYSGQINYSDFTPEDAKKLKAHEHRASRLVDGYAASHYGVSNVGAALHRSKYENGGDFPDFLLRKVLTVFGKKYRNMHFDLVLYTPPTKSGDLMKNFAIKFAAATGIPISHELIKTRTTQEQKIFQNTYSKRDNVEGAFGINAETVSGKNILLLDDIYDSGATIQEIGNMLSKCGANCIVPLVIAKTVGGTL